MVVQFSSELFAPLRPENSRTLTDAKPRIAGEENVDHLVSAALARAQLKWRCGPEVPDSHSILRDCFYLLLVDARPENGWSASLATGGFESVLDLACWTRRTSHRRFDEFDRLVVSYPSLSGTTCCVVKPVVDAVAAERARLQLW
ncbi:MAG TPA: hypothetical protein VF345_03150 [Chthoniobacterales bacterium]